MSRHLTLFTKDGRGGYDAILGAFWCEGSEAIQMEGDGHKCVRASTPEVGGDAK